MPFSDPKEARAAFEREVFQRVPRINRLGDQPIEDQYRAQMQAIAGALDRFFNGETKGAARPTGFVLLVFPFGEKAGRCNYISNGADRRDIVTLLKEQSKRFEGAPDVEGHA
jgi:hypothetical protein